MTCKHVCVPLLALLFSICASAQTAPATGPLSIIQSPGAPAATKDVNLSAIGISWQPGGAPQLAGTALYARQLTSSTYAFGVMDAIPEAGSQPYTIDTGLAAGVAQRIMTIGTVDLYIPIAAGFSSTGANTGWRWSTGAMAVVPVKNTHWRVLPNFRAQKSSVGSQTGYVLTFGALFGWGWSPPPK